MKAIAQLIRQRAGQADAPAIKNKKRKLQIDQAGLAKAAFERYRGAKTKGADDFLSEDGPSYDSDDYVNTTGLEDDGYVDVEGDGDKRKAMLMKAMRKFRSR